MEFEFRRGLDQRGRGRCGGMGCGGGQAQHGTKLLLKASLLLSELYTLGFQSFQLPLLPLFLFAPLQELLLVQQDLLLRVLLLLKVPLVVQLRNRVSKIVRLGSHVRP